MDVISQTKAYIFSVSMENRGVKLCYLSETQNNANRLEALHFLLWQNKLPQTKNTRKLKTVCLMLTTDGLFLSVYVWLCFWSCCCLAMHASQKKKQVKMTSQNLNCSTCITMPVHDFKLNEDTTAYKDEHQNRSIRLRRIILRFMSGHHIFIILLTSAQKCYAPICLFYICPPFFLILCKFSFPYCLWLCCLCLGLPKTIDERKGNTTTNSKRKKVCTIPNKRLGKCSSEMLPIRIYPCTVVVKKIKTLNITFEIKDMYILFLAVKEIKLLDTVLGLNSKDHLELIWVQAYLFSFTGNCVKLFSYILILWKLYIMSGCYIAISLIKKIYINQILEFISLIMRLFVETETAE